MTNSPYPGVFFLEAACTTDVEFRQMLLTADNVVAHWLMFLNAAYGNILQLTGRPVIGWWSKLPLTAIYYSWKPDRSLANGPKSRLQHIYFCRPLKHQEIDAQKRTQLAKSKWIYSRLSLSRIPRDSLKHFERSIPRHIRVEKVRKTINWTTTFNKWICNLTPEVRNIYIK